MLRQLRTPSGLIEYDLRRTDRKSIECRVSAKGAVVFAPLKMPQKAIDEFLRLRADWIRESGERLTEQAGRIHERLTESLSDGAAIPLEGKSYTLRLLPGAKKQALIRGGEIIVSGSDSAEEIRAVLRAHLAELAAGRFAGRVRHYAPIVGVQPNRITVREQKTKWGSCSGKGNLNFNWKLIMARPEALDYVVVHELCHMVHMDHSPDFWALVGKHMPDYKKWQDYLKKDFRALL